MAKSFEQSVIEKLCNGKVDLMTAPAFVCATIDGVLTPHLLPTTAGPYTVSSDGTLLPVDGVVVVDALGCKCDTLECPPCPEFTLGDILDSDGAAATLPFTRGTLLDLVVPFAPLDAPACLTDLDPTTIVRVRVDVSHSIDASSGHTGFAASMTDGTTSYPAVATSNGGASVGYGPGSAPHAGFTEEPRWNDYDVPLSALLSGALTWNTSGFGTFNGVETETIHSVAMSWSPDDTVVAASCGCSDNEGCC